MKKYRRNVNGGVESKDMSKIDIEMLRLAKKLDGRFYPVEDVEIGDYVEACFMDPNLLSGTIYEGTVVSISNHRDDGKFIDVLIAEVTKSPFTYCFYNENSYWRKIPKP